MANDLEVKRYNWVCNAINDDSDTVTIDSVDTSKAFARPINTLWGANNGGAKSHIKDLGAIPHITGATTCTVELTGSSNNSTVREGYFEVWEYTGPAGGTSEIKVLHHAEETITGTSTVITLDNTATDLSKCVVILGGINGPDFGDNDTTIGDRTAVRLEVTATNQVTATRYDGSTNLNIGLTVVEFTGSDWTVNKLNGSHPASTSGSATHSLGFSVSSWDNAFYFFSHETGSGNTGADDITLLPFVGGASTSQFKTWHNVSTATPPEFTLYVVEHASASVEHNDAIDGTMPMAPWKPTTTITAPTDHDLSTALGFYGASDDPTTIMSSAAWTGWLSNSTTFAVDYGSGSADEHVYTSLQVIDLDAIAGSTLTAVEVGIPSSADTASGVTTAKIYYETAGLASASDTALSVSAVKYTTVGLAGELGIEPLVGIDYSGGTSISLYGSDETLFEQSAGSGFTSVTGPLGESDAMLLPWEDNFKSARGYGVTSGGFTIAYWWKQIETTLTGSSTRYVYARDTYSPYDGLVILHWNSEYTGTAIRVTNYNDSTATDTLYVSNCEDVKDGSWHHITFVVNDANTELSVYVDGEFRYSEAATITPPSSGDAFWGPRVGWTSGTTELDVAIPAFEVFDQALTAEQVAVLPGQIHHTSGAHPVTATKYATAGTAYERPHNLVPQLSIDMEPLPSAPVNYGWDQYDTPDGGGKNYVVMPNGEKAIELPWQSNYTGINLAETHTAGSTIAFWLKLDITLGDGYSTRTTTWNSAGGRGQNILFYSTGQVRVRRYHAGGWDQQEVIGATDLTQDWHHYTATLSDDLTTVKFYVDGELVSTLTDAYEAPADAYAGFRGWSGWTSGDGSEAIDLWQGPQEVFDRELTQDEIRAVMAQPYRGFIGAQTVGGVKYIESDISNSTDTAFDVDVARTYYVTVGVADSATSAHPVDVARTYYVDVGLPSETTSTFVVTPVKYLEVGTAVWGFQALPVSASKESSVDPTTATDSAFDVSAEKRVAVDTTTSTATANGTTSAKYVFVSESAESDTSHAVIARYVVTVDAASETSESSSVTVAITDYVDLGVAESTDIADTALSTKYFTVETATFGYQALPVTARKEVTVAEASEISDALSVDTEETVNVTLERALEVAGTFGVSVEAYSTVESSGETSTADSTEVAKFALVGIAEDATTVFDVSVTSETQVEAIDVVDTALPVEARSIHTLDSTQETFDTASALTTYREYSVGVAHSTDQAAAIQYSTDLLVSLGIPTSSDEALAVETVTYASTGIAEDIVDIALPVQGKASISVFAPTTVDEALPVETTKTALTVWGIEFDTAYAVEGCKVAELETLAQIDAVLDVEAAKFKTVKLAPSFEQSLPVSGYRNLLADTATSTDEALSTQVDKYILSATETTTSLPVTWRKYHKFVSALAIEKAECDKFSAAKCV